MGSSINFETPLAILGRIIAADIVMNNPDRVPAIWGNPGNEGNIMFQSLVSEHALGKSAEEIYMDPKNTQDIEVYNIVAIDNKSYCIKTE
jgi:hypothetical protein